LTERDEPQAEQPTTPAIAQAPKPQAPSSPNGPPQVQGKPESEIVPTNPKPDGPAAQSGDLEKSKTKPIPAEPAVEIAKTNPRSAIAFSAPVRETAASGPQISAKSEPAAEVKAPPSLQEAELPVKPGIRSEPAREISIRIPSSDHGNVEVQIVERNGKVQVTVRGSDAQLNSALRGDLTELVHTLGQKGYKTETWTPNDTYPLASASAREVQTPGRNEASQDRPGNQPNDGGNGGNQGGNQQQRRQQQERPDWLVELERRLENEG
jgi:hypothetical protein